MHAMPYSHGGFMSFVLSVGQSRPLQGLATPSHTLMCHWPVIPMDIPYSGCRVCPTQVPGVFLAYALHSMKLQVYSTSWRDLAWHGYGLIWLLPIIQRCSQLTLC